MHSKDKKKKVALELQISLCSRHAAGRAQAGAPLRGHTETSSTPGSLPDTMQNVPARKELGICVY